MRFLWAVVLVLAPWVVAGAMIAAGPGALVGAAAGLAFVLLVLFRAERILISLWSARTGSALPAGLRASHERALEGTTRRIRLAVVNESRHFVVPVRALGAGGTIFLTQGLLSALTEDELRQLFRSAARELERRGSAPRAFCLALGVLLFRISPRHSHPVAAVTFLLFLPVLRILHSGYAANAAHLGPDPLASALDSVGFLR